MVMPGQLGLDHAYRPTDYRAFAQAAVKAGFSFEFRYLCDPNAREINQHKIARKEEVDIARQEGLEVAFIWQNTKQDAHGGYNAGLQHGGWAEFQAVVLGAPTSTTIYFAVGDYDAPTSDFDMIADYLRGVRDGIGPYRIGGYGKRSVVEEMKRRGLITKVWQSYGFSRPVGEVSPHADVYQRREQTTIAGVTCDVNESFRNDIGEWRTPLRIPSQLIAMLRKEGIDVPEHMNPWGRGGSISFVKYLVWHHTATGKNWTDYNLRELLRKGRSDLPGPLSQFGLERDGQLPMIADGRANHNGYGDGGNNTWAIEAANDGRGEPWPNTQIDIYCRASAVMCLFMRVTPDAWVRGHKETDPSRKVDPVGINMDHMRQAVAAHMARMSGFAPAPAPPPPPPYSVVKRGLRLNQLRSALMRLQMTINLDDMGRGWVPLDGIDGRPKVPFGDLISVRPQGSNPMRDGYWPVPETGEQNHNGLTLLTVEGGSPGGSTTLFLVVPDA